MSDEEAVQDLESDADEELNEGPGDDVTDVTDVTDDTDGSGDDEDDEDADEKGPRPVGGSEHEDDEEPDPDDVEADLEAILRDRISASDDDEEDEDEGPATTPGGTDQPSARQETELVCPHCFLLVQAATVAETGECGHCGGPIS
ncbi:MAG: hypothetical protein MK199_08990 [Acidimicrobiales bacterium]|nr:hypothetical protein [Acidimicrobiales bacterium]